MNKYLKTILAICALAITLSLSCYLLSLNSKTLFEIYLLQGQKQNIDAQTYLLGLQIDSVENNNIGEETLQEGEQ